MAYYNIDPERWVCCRCRHENLREEQRCETTKSGGGLNLNVGVFGIGGNKEGRKCGHLNCSNCLRGWMVAGRPASPATGHYSPIQMRPSQGYPPVIRNVTSLGHRAPGQPRPQSKRYYVEEEEDEDEDEEDEDEDEEDEDEDEEEEEEYEEEEDDGDDDEDDDDEPQLWKSLFDINLRSGPGLQYPIVSQMNYGEITRESARAKGWMYHTPINSKISGWSSLVYMKQKTFLPV